MRNTVIAITALYLAFALGTALLAGKETPPEPLRKLKAEYGGRGAPTADHAKFDALKKSFSGPREVTAACLGCHNRADAEVMNSSHWSWDRAEHIPGRGVVYLGKRNAINNFCISTPGNEGSCAKCHAGSGRGPGGAVPADRYSVDCLVCHDGSETYAKAPDGAGAPAGAVNLGAAARSVGRPKRGNCGVCHFFGGGGNNVKHGDLEKAQFEPSRDLDVHMASAGANLQCVDCHRTKDHQISGKLYSLSSMDRNRVSCEQCHAALPHKDPALNSHTAKVACQSCHIPAYARANPTKMSWDWSTAGKLKDGKPFVEEDAGGNHAYMTIKGSFTWATQVKPSYAWFNGNASHYLAGDKIEDPSKPLALNPLLGSYADDGSKLVPVKVHRAAQPYDPVNKTLILPHLYAKSRGEGAYWRDFDWEKAAAAGMKKAGLPFSGRVAFMKTEMNWPVNHMVAPKEKAVTCEECHSADGRLAGVGGFYLPGRDRSEPVEKGGKLLLALTLLGVTGHGAARFVSRRARKGEK